LTELRHKPSVLARRELEIEDEHQRVWIWTAIRWTLEQALAQIDVTVGKTLAPIHDRARLLTTLPGVSDLTARVMVAEIGVDMTRLPRPPIRSLLVRVCPRSEESAGKRRSTRVRKGAPWLKTALVTAAWAAVRVKNSYLQAQSSNEEKSFLLRAQCY
jgi:transposase